MQTDTQVAPLSKSKLWAGRIITALVALFLAFDGVTKIIQLAPVIEACEKLGIPRGLVLGIGILLLVCTAVYLVPQTEALGAILLTGYLGGATAIQVRAESGAFPIAFALSFGVLVWVGLILRRPHLLSMILPRR